MVEKHHKLQPKPKATADELKVALQTSREELPQEHINKAVANFIKRLTFCTWLWLPTVGTSSICNRPNSIYLEVCILFSSPTNWLFSEAATHYRWRLRLDRWEMRAVSVKQHNFVIFSYNSTKLGDKVYILLLNSSKFHAKICTHCRNIDKSHKGLYFYGHPIYTRSLAVADSVIGNSLPQPYSAENGFAFTQNVH